MRFTRGNLLADALAGGVAAWFAVMAAAFACSLELAAGGTIEFGKVLPAILGVHAVIGIGEALATTIVLAIAWRLERHQALSLATRWRAAVGLGLALCIALFLAPLACPAPDGLNSVAATYHFGFAEQQADFGLIPNYKVPSVSEAWQPLGRRHDWGVGGVRHCGPLWPPECKALAV